MDARVNNQSRAIVEEDLAIFHRMRKGPFAQELLSARAARGLLKRIEQTGERFIVREGRRKRASAKGRRGEKTKKEKKEREPPIAGLSREKRETRRSY